MISRSSRWSRSRSTRTAATARVRPCRPPMRLHVAGSGAWHARAGPRGAESRCDPLGPARRRRAAGGRHVPVGRHRRSGPGPRRRVIAGSTPPRPSSGYRPRRRPVPPRMDPRRPSRSRDAAFRGLERLALISTLTRPPRACAYFTSVPSPTLRIRPDSSLATYGWEARISLPACRCERPCCSLRATRPCSTFISVSRRSTSAASSASDRTCPSSHSMKAVFLNASSPLVWRRPLGGGRALDIAEPAPRCPRGSHRAS